MRKYLIRNIIWCVIIFVLCAVPGDSLPAPTFSIPYLDKMVHFGMFFVMGFLLCAELKYQAKLSFTKITIITVSAVALYGGVIELMQHYVFESRSGDYIDFIADISGGLLSAFIFPMLNGKKNRVVEK